jgi:glycine cleavage system aminomethyltransferase T
MTQSPELDIMYVQGSDAGALLDKLSTASVDGESERITYSQWLNPQVCFN